MIKRVNIWDLDGTVINSFKRVQPCILANGDLDLDRYRREACTHEAIMGDSLLPLVEVMRQSVERGEYNVIVTARMLSKSDYYFLRRQGLRGRGKNSIQVHSRDTLVKHFGSAGAAYYHLGDAEYKGKYFALLQSRFPDATFTVYDDHDGVLDTAARMGMRAVDAKLVNDVLSIGVSLAGEQFIDDSLSDDLDIDYLNERLAFAWDTMTDEEKESYGHRPSVHQLVA